MMKVPASMRSGIMRCRAPWSLSTPLMRIVDVPRRYLRAHGVEQCGQVGDFRFASAVCMTVSHRPTWRPSAGLRFHHGDFVEDNSAPLSRPPFEDRGGLDVAVLLRNLRAQALETLIWRSMGRAPMAHPPGNETRARHSARRAAPGRRRGAHGLDQLIRRFGSGQGAGANRGAVMSSP